MFSAKDWDDFCEQRFKTQRVRHCTNTQYDEKDCLDTVTKNEYGNEILVEYTGEE